MITDTEVKSPLRSAAPGHMKALVYHGPGKRAWDERPKPAIREATDAIVRITTSTICGTDLHILKGDVPSVTPTVGFSGTRASASSRTLAARCRVSTAATAC